MSRYRPIYVTIWNDDKFPYLSEGAKLVYLHILTTPMSNSLGLYKTSVAALADEARIPLERYRELFGELLREGLIKYDARTLMVFIPRFIRYNPPPNGNVMVSWARTFDELPRTSLDTEWYSAAYSGIYANYPDLAKKFEALFSKEALK